MDEAHFTGEGNANMILFFDTETDGLPNFRKPIDDPSQPRLVQIACLLTDNNGKHLTKFASIVKINGDRPIPDAASAVHHITTEDSMIFGIPNKMANSIWHRLASMADTIVAHNIKFDWFVMESSILRMGGDLSKILPLPVQKQVCTMEMATPLVNLPPTERMIAAGMDKPKPPRLSECIKFFFNRELDGAHDALVDVEACAEIYFHIILAD